MVVVSLAAAAVALSLGAGPKADSPVATLFKSYCDVKTGTSQPYCGDTVPENVEWLVLYSLCSADSHDVNYNAVCSRFKAEIVEHEVDAQRRFLAYRPRADQWSGLAFSTKKGKDGKCAQGMLDGKEWYCRGDAGDWLDIDETGLATITRSASDNIPVIIVGTNPLLYRTTPETVTSENIAALESLQQLALGLGGALQAAVGIYAKSKTDFSAMHAFIAKNQQLKPPPAAKQEPDALIDVVLLYDQIIAKMATASRALAEKAGAAGLARSQAIVLIQDVEQRLVRPLDQLTVPITKTDSGTLAYSDLDKAYTTLDIAYRDVRDFGGPCRQLLNDFLFIMQHADAAETLLRPRIKEYVEAHRAYPECTGKFATLAKQIGNDAQALLNAGTGQPFAGLIDKTSTNYNASLTVIVKPPPKPPGAEDKDPEPLDAALELLTTKRNDALPAYNGLVTAARRREDYTFAETTLLTWLYAPPKSDGLPWDKLQTHTFSLKPNGPLASGVTAEHTDTELKYKLQSNQVTGLGVGVGVFYTKLSTPTFDAVTDPNNKDQKVVSQTDTSTLAGQLALFADWRVLSAFSGKAEHWVVRPSLQIGTNVSSTPGFFTGLGFDVFKYFRFGVGRTWQQSKELDPSQTLDKTVVASKDDIKTRDIFAHDWYYSFSFALDSLPLFKKSDSGSGGSTTKKGDDSGESSGDDAAATKAKDTKAKKGG
jgi:hypothetical protein